MVASIASYEHVAKLIHCRALMRDDPDYFEHRHKGVYSILLCDDCPEAIRDFARRHHVPVIAQPGPRDSASPRQNWRQSRSHCLR